MLLAVHALLGGSTHKPSGCSEGQRQKRLAVPCENVCPPLREHRAEAVGLTLAVVNLAWTVTPEMWGEGGAKEGPETRVGWPDRASVTHMYAGTRPSTWLLSSSLLQGGAKEKWD